jgi:hypothetical protein
MSPTRFADGQTGRGEASPLDRAEFDRLRIGTNRLGAFGCYENFFYFKELQFRGALLLRVRRREHW